MDYEKNDYYCKVCSVECSGPEAYQQHLKGRKHKKEVLRKGDYPKHNLKNTYYCQVCDIMCSAPENFQEHIQGRKHLRLERRLKNKMKKLQEEDEEQKKLKDELLKYEKLLENLNEDDGKGGIKREEVEGKEREEDLGNQHTEMISPLKKFVPQKEVKIAEEKFVGDKSPGDFGVPQGSKGYSPSYGDGDDGFFNGNIQRHFTKQPLVFSHQDETYVNSLKEKINFSLGELADFYKKKFMDYKQEYENKMRVLIERNMELEKANSALNDKVLKLFKEE